MIRSIFLIATLTATLLITPAIDSWSGEKYTLSMLPRYSPEEIMKRITPLADYLTRKTGLTITPVISRDFKEYTLRLRRGNITIGYENPYIYTLVSQEHEAIAKAVKGKSGDRFRGIIITRIDSNIVEIGDLKGKTVSIVSKTSAGGFLSQKATLQKYGFNLDKDLELIEALDNKQENVLLSVYYGDVDAGFIRESALHIADNYLAPGQIKVIKRTEWLPNWALSVNKKIAPVIRQSIKKALLELQNSDTVLKALKIKRFKKVTDAEYNIVRRAAGLPIP